MTPPPARARLSLPRGRDLCLLIGLATRIAIAIYATRAPAAFDYPDSHRYAAVAMNIAAGRGPIDSPQVRCGTDPLYPHVLAVGTVLGARSFAALALWGRGANVLFGMAAMLAIMRLADRAAGPTGGLVAGALAAVDPIFVFCHGLLLTEVLFTALLAWSLEWLLAAIDEQRASPAALSGAALALAALTRSSALLLIVPWVGLLCFGRSAGSPSARRPGATARAAAAAIVFALVIAPAAIRNHRLLGAWVPIRTGVGATLMEGLGDWADGGPGMERIVYPALPPGAGELERDRACRRAAIDWAAAHPRQTLRLAGAKLARLWSITLHAPGYRGGWADVVCWLTVAPVFAAAAIGVWTLRRRRTLLAALLAAPLYYTAQHTVFIGSVRYRVPLLAMIYVLAATTMVAGVARRSAAPARHRP